MVKQSFILFLFLLFGTVYGQEVIQLDGRHADCDQAIDITGQNEVRATAPKGSGRWMEVHSSKTSLYSFSNEHNTVWYRFEVEQSCEMSFIITPDNTKDDYDFLLYRVREEQSCQFIRKGELKPIRSNISRPSSSGQTGLSSKGTSYYVHEGKGNVWSKPIVVKRGEVFYLVLDNVYEDGQGHRIQFFYSNCKAETEALHRKWSVNINVKDQESNRLIRGNILLIDQSKGYKNYDTIYNKVSSSVFIPIEPERYYECVVWAEGYLKSRETIKMDSADKPLRLDMKLQAVSIGKTFVLDNLYFEGGTSKIVRKSYPALRKLLAIMKDNTSLIIEIQGHVNLSMDKNKKRTEEYYQELSERRAQTVLDYLSKRGISKKRMTYIGYGYSKMVYSKAKTPEQMQRNRRVVVKVVQF